MKNILPKKVYYNGAEIEATKLSLSSIYDNLSDSAIFSVTLYSDNNTPLYKGEIKMMNPDYQLWNGDHDINNSAYLWAAAILNVTLL